MLGEKMKTECICPYCKKKFEAEVVVKMNPYMKPDQVPMVSEVGISKYETIEGE